MNDIDEDDEDRYDSHLPVDYSGDCTRDCVPCSGCGWCKQGQRWDEDRSMWVMMEGDHCPICGSWKVFADAHCAMCTIMLQEYHVWIESMKQWLPIRQPNVAEILEKTMMKDEVCPGCGGWKSSNAYSCKPCMKKIDKDFTVVEEKLKEREVEAKKRGRPSFDAIYMSLAVMLSQRSTCKRAKVGCVVATADHHQILAIGYNGNAIRAANTCDSDEPGHCGCIHAECNSLIKLNYSDHHEKKLYTTCSPCVACAKMIVNAGISEVVYLHEYRDTTGLQLLRSANIPCKKMDPDDIFSFSSREMTT